MHKIHRIRAVSPETHHAPVGAVSNRATLKQKQDLHDAQDLQDSRGFTRDAPRPGRRGLKPRN